MKRGFTAKFVMPALCLASTPWRNICKKDVDGRDKPGHDEKENRFQEVRESLKMLDTYFGKADFRPSMAARPLAGLLLSAVVSRC